MPHINDNGGYYEWREKNEILCALQTNLLHKRIIWHVLTLSSHSFICLWWQKWLGTRPKRVLFISLSLGERDGRTFAIFIEQWNSLFCAESSNKRSSTEFTSKTAKQDKSGFSSPIGMHQVGENPSARLQFYAFLVVERSDGLLAVQNEGETFFHPDNWRMWIRTFTWRVDWMVSRKRNVNGTTLIINQGEPVRLMTCLVW